MLVNHPSTILDHSPVSPPSYTLSPTFADSLKLDYTKGFTLRRANEDYGSMNLSEPEDADSSFVIDIKNQLSERGIEGPVDLPVRALSPVTSNAMNALNTASTPPPEYHNYHEKRSTQSTIRSVTSDSIVDESRRNQSPIPSMPHSTKTLPNLPKISTSHPPQTHQTRQNGLAIGNGLVRSISSEFGVTRSYSNNNLHPTEDAIPSIPNNDTTTSPGNVPGTPAWSSAIGPAKNAGKSGRVIERLMGENDMLKRDLHIERLRAEESRQSIKMVEEQTAAMITKHEVDLHDAAINKTLLKRRERQLADLKAQIDGEKKRADSAVERERLWRDAKEKTEEESKRTVEDAQQYAALMEGRVNTMVTHWKDQNSEVEKTVENLSSQINDLVEVRRNDDKKIHTLQGLCEQQREMLIDLERKKEAIGQAFEAYKQEQEDSLRDIKDKAREQEARNEATIKETVEVLGNLKWALNVHNNVNLDKPV